MNNLFYLAPYNLQHLSPGEEAAVTQVFGERTSHLLTDIPAGSVVIPRFRSIPFGRELEEEVAALGSILINSYRQHRSVADIFSWVHLLKGLTPPCYDLEDLAGLPEGEYFLKGETNSVKNAWFTKAYAASKREALQVASALTEDAYVGSQRLVVRPFQHFRQLATAVDGRPVFHERRVFSYQGRVLSQAFYWSSFAEEVGVVTALDEQQYQQTLAEALRRVQGVAPFLVVDLAEYPDGSWAVVELNDACMSGLSENAPLLLWQNLQRAVAAEELLPTPVS